MKEMDSRKTLLVRNPCIFSVLIDSKAVSIGAGKIFFMKQAIGKTYTDVHMQSFISAIPSQQNATVLYGIMILVPVCDLSQYTHFLWIN